jgi:Rrf2 family protein
MILRNQVEWAIHCCAVLAGLGEGERISTKKLAEFHGVPKEYLSKALQALAQAGIVEGSLGPSGGYRLARESAAICLLDIVEAVEGKRSTFECSEIRLNNPCLKKGERKAVGICAVARAMYRADEAWRSELRNYSLSHLVKDVVGDVPVEQIARSLDWLRAK